MRSHPMLCTLAVAAACASCAAPEAGTVLDKEAQAVSLLAPSLAGLDLVHSSPFDLEAALATPIDAARAVEIALRHNRRTRSALAHLGMVRADAVQESLPGNPALGFLVRIFDPGTEVEGALVQPLARWFLLPRLEARAGYRLEAARAEAAKTLLEHALQVRMALLDCQVAAARVPVLQDLHRIALEGAALMERLRAAGNVAEDESVAESLIEAEARLALARGESRLHETRIRLEGVLGLFGAEAGRLEVAPLPAGEAPAIAQPERIEEQAIRSSLLLRSLVAKANALAQEEGIAGTLVALGDSGIGPAFQRDPDGELGLGLDGSLELPLFDDGGWARLSASLHLRALLERIHEEAVSIRAAARRIALAHRDRRAESEYLSETLAPLYDRQTLVILQRYNAMQIGAFDVLRARASARAAALRSLDARHEHLVIDLMAEALATGITPPDRSGPTGEESMPAGAAARKEH